ncbi:synapse defective 1 [Mactra antiquata]
MAQGPGRLNSRQRHDSQQTTQRSTKRSLSAESRPYKYSTYVSQRVRPSTGEHVADDTVIRRPGSEDEYHSNYGAKNRTSNRNGAPEMGIKTIEMENSSVIQTVEIFKRPGQTLGFYIREGNGQDRQEGVFISRIQAGTVAESNGLLHIGDEIMSVNSVEVGKMSLDDVVILMSIPRKLILKIRSKKNCTKKNASCPSLAIVEKEEPPVVVLKKGHVRANSDTQLEMTEKIPNMFEPSPHIDNEYYGKRLHRQERTTSQYASIFISPHKAEAKLLTGDDNNSEHSSEGSLPRSIDSGSRDRDHYAGHRGYSNTMIPAEDPYGYLAPSSLPTYSLPPSDSMEREYNKMFHKEPKYSVPSHQRSPSKSNTLSHSASRNRYYSSDSDRGAFSDTYQALSECNYGYRGYTEGSRRYVGGFREMIHSKAKYGGKPQRARSPECYNSDSEVLYNSPSGAVLAADSRGFASDYETYAGAMSDEEPVYAVPKPISSSSSSELQMLLRKFNTLSHELQQEQNRLQQQLTARDKPTTGLYVDYAVLYYTAFVFRKMVFNVCKS